MSLCPACENPLTKGMIVQDHSVSKEKFQLLVCGFCGLMKTDFPEGKDIGPYYQSEDYISHTSRPTGLVQRLYLLVRDHTLNIKFRLLRSLDPPTTSIADIGCGTGDFLKRMNKGGWEISGVEPSDNARAIAERKTGSTIGKDLRALSSTVGIVTMWHVLEHLPDPAESIRKLKENLQPGGTMVIAVPNYRSEDGQYYQEHWAGLDVPRHLWHFTRQSMSLLANKAGLNVSAVMPMKFDSFYVSMLSEGYKKGRSSKLKDLVLGSLTGLRSNWKASRTGEYSSLIYILRK